MKKIYDVLVIGAGIVGAGILRDLAMQGLSVCGIDKNNVPGQTTINSTGIIHRSLRSLLYDVSTTKKCCEDSRRLIKIAPHLLRRLPFLLPIFPNDKYGMEKWETLLERYDDFQILEGDVQKHGRLSKKEALKIDNGISEKIIGALTLEELEVDARRLVEANIMSAKNHGADFYAAEVIGFIKEKNAVKGVKTAGSSGNAEKIYAKIVCIAAGPWSAEVADMANITLNLRPTKGVHLVFEDHLVSRALIAQAIDGRVIFIIPRQNKNLGEFTVVGTTDTDFYGDPDNLNPTEDEIGYLWQAAERIAPRSFQDAKLYRVMVGIRPTLGSWDALPDNLTRGHAVYDHLTRDGVAGLVSTIGGKMSAYLMQSEETTSLILKKLGTRRKMNAYETRLPDVPEDISNPWGKKLNVSFNKRKHLYNSALDSAASYNPRWSKIYAWTSLALYYVKHTIKKWIK